MKLTHSCIITADVARLRDFYAQVLQIEPQQYGERYVEFPTGGGTLSIFDVTAHETLAPGSAKPGTNRALELEFEVADVDAAYARLQALKINWVKPPTTQAWGNRSVYFRDPDGNLINFYTRIHEEDDV